MAHLSQRSTIYFDPNMHKALRLKAAQENRSVSDIVNEAVSLLAVEDAVDIADFDKVGKGRSTGIVGKLAEDIVGFVE